MALDEALAFTERAEVVYEELQKLHLDHYATRAQIAAKYDELRQAMKLAEVHSNLAIAEQLRGLREDFADVPVPYTLPDDQRPHLVTFDGHEG